MMRRCAGLDTDETRRQLLEESSDVTALQLAPDDHLAFRVDAMDLKNRDFAMSRPILVRVHVRTGGLSLPGCFGDRLDFPG
jgi:hypothetical protein